MNIVMYYIAMVIGAPFAALLFKTKVSYEGGRKFRVPKGAIIISGHKSFLDAVAIAVLFFFRRLYYLAADWYVGWRKVFKPLMAMVGAVFVDLKGRRFDFLSRSAHLLDRGYSLVVFPEGDYGARGPLFEFGPFGTGYLLIAFESGAPIVPVVSDFNYGIFRRLRLVIGQPIYPSLPEEGLSSRERTAALNEEIRERCFSLFYEIKREKARKVKMHYDYLEPHRGDVIRVNCGPYYHYGIYFGDDSVLEFGRAYNPPGPKIDVHYTSLRAFGNGALPEVRVLKNPRKARKIEEIEAYAKEVLGRSDYSLEANNCLDLVNRLTLRI